MLEVAVGAGGSEMLVVGIVLGVLLGGLVGWIFCRSSYLARLAAADVKTRLVEGEGVATRERLSAAEGQLRAAEKQCAALAAKLEESQSRLEDQKQVLREDVIRKLTEPIKETLAQYDIAAKNLETTRIEELSLTRQRVEDLGKAKDVLGLEVGKLVSALRSNDVRGDWGQIALRRILELAGMTSYCDFVEQEHVPTEARAFRPDVVVKLPAKREIIVDAKAPAKAFLKALDAPTEKEKSEALAEHANHVRQHVVALSSKEYWQHFETLEFVIMFIPNDSFLAAAAQQDPDLIQDALERKVVMATPTTLYALLRAIECGWRQERVAESAQKVGELGRELADRIATWVDHMSKVGQSLKNAVESYDAAVGSLETRVLISARKFEALGAGGTKEIVELKPIEKAPRVPASGNPKSD